MPEYGRDLAVASHLISPAIQLSKPHLKGSLLLITLMDIYNLRDVWKSTFTQS